MIVDLSLGHMEALQKIHREDFPLPNLNNKLYFAKRGVELGGKLEAAGFLKVTSEAILIVNPELGRLARAKIITELLKCMVYDLDRANVEDTHVFLQGNEAERTGKFLEKFSFIPLGEKSMYLPPRRK